MKYAAAGSEAEHLPNLLSISDPDEIGRLEMAGFSLAYEILLGELQPTTRFNIAYLYNLHWLAFRHLYDFAGKLRSVNISKGGYMFPAAAFLDRGMRTFDTEVLSRLPHVYPTAEQLINDIGHVHAELLFIHPFREGNGRTARMLADLMAIKAGYPPLDFQQLITSEGYDPRYIAAVEAAGRSNYQPMQQLIRTVFSHG